MTDIGLSILLSLVIGPVLGYLFYRAAVRQRAINEALDLIFRYGGIDGDHHKTWVIDQTTRALTGAYYDEWVRTAKAGEDGPDTYSWDEGIAP